MSRVVAYTRVSTLDQAEHGLGLDVQRESIRRWAKAEGHRVVAWHCDEGVSGTKPPADRPGCFEALAAMRNGAAGIVVARLDRLSRDLIQQELLFREVWRLGKDVWSCVPAEAQQLAKDDPDDPTRTLLRHLLGVLAQWERSTVVLRLRLGRQRKKAQGGFAGGGVPYGRRNGDRELVPDPAEAAAVALMVRLRRAGASYRGIVAALAAAGHAPRKGGQVWQPGVVRRVLLREEAA